MFNFKYYNPVQIVFGKNEISTLNKLIEKNETVGLFYGGGSIKKNGVYDQITNALSGFTTFDFGGIEANPDHDTCMRATQFVKEKKITFLLAIGGGSVLDAVKYISLATYYTGDPWEILNGKAELCKKALPLGSVLTLPATGSEMNTNSVISRRSTGEKKAFSSPLVFPKFSILDPETTYSLDARQTANGVIDAFVHVFEQYLTSDTSAPLQARQCEAILSTLIEEGPKVLEFPTLYSARANVMWCATQALNGLIGVGCKQDWASHAIGHELTATYGLDHGQTLAILAPQVFRYSVKLKEAKLAMFARRVWHFEGNNESELAEMALIKTEDFFRSLGVKTKLCEYNINSSKFKEISNRVCNNKNIGEANLTNNDVEKILICSYE